MLRSHHALNLTAQLRRFRWFCLLMISVLGSACDEAQVKLQLTPNKYLVLPYGTAEVDGGDLSIVASGLWPLAGGGHYLCWLRDSKSGRVRRLGELQSGPLHVDGSTTGLRLADYDRLACTVEAEVSPAEPSPVEALNGEVGGLLLFGDEGLLSGLMAARAACRIDGMRADYSYQDLPPLPGGFRYAVYLLGVLPDVNAGPGVGTTHQHLSAAAATTSTESSSSADQLLLLGRLASGTGAGTYWEPAGRNLTGHRKALLAIEPEEAGGQPSLFPLAGPQDAAASLHPPAAPSRSQTGSYQVQLTTTPTDLHLGEVASFLFRVSEAGEPVSGLAPTVTFKHATAGSGPIPVGPGGDPGSYVGSKAFFVEGSYQILFAFSRSGESSSTTFELTIEQH